MRKMNGKTGFRALVVDDDPDALQYISYVLRREIPELEVTCRVTADVSGVFDVYLLDNDFAGRRIAGQLTEEIRLVNPRALILAFSASLDVATLKGLLNAGCDAVADKSEAAEQALLVELIQRYIESVVVDQANGPTRTGTLGSVIELLREWNRRYENSRISGVAS